MSPEEKAFIEETLTSSLRNGHGRELLFSLMRDALEDGDRDKLRALQAAMGAPKEEWRFG
jgi:hypothetical protein